MHSVQRAGGRRRTGLCVSGPQESVCLHTYSIMVDKMAATYAMIFKYTKGSPFLILQTVIQYYKNRKIQLGVIYILAISVLF